MKSKRLFKKKSKGWEKLDESFEQLDVPHFTQHHREPLIYTENMNDFIDPNDIKIGVHCEAYTISFMWGKDSIKIPGISEQYLAEFTKITKCAIQQKCMIQFKCTKLNKTDPSTVSQTFLIVK